MPYQLLVWLFLCHWLGDYSHLQTAAMIRAKATGKPAWLIFAHACVHGLLMLAVLLFYVHSQILIQLVAFQIGTHFLIDFWKSRMNTWFPAVKNPANQYHWLVFGFDQFLHHTVIVVMVWWLNP